MRRLGLVLALVLHASIARAGGFETPDNGSEALGRGGAFTAKASDGTALEYNVAGLARQRGTRLLLDGKVTFDQYQFTRDGVYPGPSDNTTPWGNHFFPTVTNQGPPLVAPFVALSTDFGRFDDLTVAVGLFAPSGVGNPTYPLGVPEPPGQVYPPGVTNTGGWPSPSRYDVVQANSVLALPTVAAGYKVSELLDVGLGAHYVIGSFDLVSTSFADSSNCYPTPPKTSTTPPVTVPEYQPCDVVNHLVLSGSTFAFSGGIMLHPEPWWDIGLNARSKIHIDATGSVAATPSQAAPAQGGNAAATFSTELPWQLRLGTRLVARDGGFEHGDFEVDAVYETWSASQGVGSFVTTGPIGVVDGVHAVVVHKYQDVYSLRVGGAYNIPIGPAVLTLRAGGYYESPATQPADTRLDFNTLAKLAGTGGLGFTWRGIGVNVAYAGIYSPERVVSNGEIAPINPVQKGASLDAQGNPLPAINNGRYDGLIQMISFGLRVELETLFGTKRSKKWAGEAGAGDAPEAPKAETPAEQAPPAAETKPEEKPAPAPEAPKPVPKPETKPRRKGPPKDDNEKTRKLEDPFAT
jgi:long-subunit fatty acid transport protein